MLYPESSDKSLYQEKPFLVSANEDPLSTFHFEATTDFTLPVAHGLSTFSTLTSDESLKDSEVTKVDISELSQISRRFVFSAIQNPKRKTQRGPRLSTHLKTKFHKRPLKKEVVDDLPLIIALKSRNQPSLVELYGSFSEMLGSGSGGRVYSTYSMACGGKFAIKTFRPIRGSEGRRHYYEIISNEIYIGASLDHPNIIKTIDVALEDGQIHQVMEFCSMDMVALFKGVNMGEHQINRYFVQMVNSLQYLHQRGIAHRDLKLENFCLGEDGLIKLIDFGCAFIFGDSLSRKRKLATSITGTDPYIAPEVHEGSPYDPAKADIWSLAIVYVCMVLRKFPWEIARPTNRAYANFLKHRHEDEFFRNIPSDTLPLIRSMLNPNPAERPSVEEMFWDPWFQSLLEKSP
ncbi:kinase-like protein [Basidiobolus meristosporus CBS 931.73]|uniref:Kinase-like protein n=1 Tax=Basidiobolus meristosporus CBS 931.73 TaxID=1314790 RepID=A0A1Y1X928_9FUNG|nr:kinase-like protein [Basidiobolus meristosporus CBS 931.73]|eukprot:ORX82247.1 kinase-like protein [Basidiobolus meristosporus CBS 931.73]